ncbi:MAG: L-seryl-tRNA(Sec) selenium transferase [Bacillota bacterium]
MLILSDLRDVLRELPAVDRLLREPLLVELSERLPRRVILAAVQETVDAYRTKLQQAAARGQFFDKTAVSPAALAREAANLAARQSRPSLQPVINATGIILHTNLGRAPLAEAAVEALSRVSGSYSNLEFNLLDGKRGSRQVHVEELLCELSGAEAAVVLNNNAAAVFLTLNSCAAGKEVIVSRGELVEIGGSFRIPEVMNASGARLVEVGTTNKTYRRDYEAAVTENTAALLKVHTSNYHIVGFTASVSAPELVSLGRAKGIPAIEDLGSGVLIDLSRYNLPPEPRVQDSIAAGMDLVTFSGDKLLGGPQAGIVVGRRELVDRLRRNQLARALRVDKFTVATLEATLRLYQDEELAVREIPVWRALTAKPSRLQERARDLAMRLEPLFGPEGVEVWSGSSRVGGGALPTAELPTCLVALNPNRVDPVELAERLRLSDPPVVVRLQHDRLILDPRTIFPEQEELLAAAIEKAYRERQ